MAGYIPIQFTVYLIASTQVVIGPSVN